MSTLAIITIIVVSGVLLWLINNYLPIADNYLKVINIVFGIVVVALLLKGFGVGL